MKKRISLEKIHVSKVFYGYIYPVLAKERRSLNFIYLKAKFMELNSEKV